MGGPSVRLRRSVAWDEQSVLAPLFGGRRSRLSDAGEDHSDG